MIHTNSFAFDPQVLHQKIFKQEAQGACGAHLFLTNPLGFVGFFSTKFYIIWHWQQWNNSKYPIYANVNCIV